MGRLEHDKAEKQGARRQRRTTIVETADWQSVNANLLLQAIAIVSSTGGALRLGYSRDGGVYAVGVYGDGEPYTEYIRPADGIEDYLEELIRSWNV